MTTDRSPSHFYECRRCAASVQAEPHPVLGTVYRDSRGVIECTTYMGMQLWHEPRPTEEPTR